MAIYRNDSFFYSDPVLLPFYLFYMLSCSEAITVNILSDEEVDRKF